MDEKAFERMKAEAMRAGPPSGGDDLYGMEIDFNAYLGGLAVLADAQARRTNDPTRLIVATADATPGAVAAEVADALEGVWTTKLRYNYRAGHLITLDSDSVRLAAITQIAPDGFFVTVEVTVALHDV